MIYCLLRYNYAVSFLINCILSPQCCLNGAPPSSTPVVPAQERSDITCHTDSISIFLPQEVIHGNRNVTWRDADFCQVFFNGSHYVDTINLLECGTTIQINEHTVIFENDLIVHRPPSESDDDQAQITHGEDYESVIPVKCIYPRRTNTSTSYLPVKQHVRFFEQRYGELEINMQQFSSEAFLDPVSVYPRKVPLNDDIFIQLGLLFNASDVGLRADNCIATSSPSPADANWYQLISAGCPVNAVRLLSLPGSSHVRFTFKAFDFTHDATGFVYIHCEVSACSVTDPACMMGCPGRARRSAGNHGNGASHLVSTGPLLVTKDHTTEGSRVPMVTVFAAVCFSVAMVAVIVAVIGWTRTPKKSTQSKPDL